jgi:hypothetical protein
MQCCGFLCSTKLASMDKNRDNQNIAGDAGEFGTTMIGYKGENPMQQQQMSVIVFGPV